MTTPPRPPGWRYAACRDVDPDIFFADPGDHYGVNAALRICGRCPIRDTSCLPWTLALDRRYPDGLQGIWAGTTFEDRARLRMVRAECGTVAGFNLHVKPRERTCPACRQARLADRHHTPVRRRPVGAVA